MRVLRPWIKSLLTRMLAKRGMALSRPAGAIDVGEIRLRQMKRRGFEARCIVDGGAADGIAAREFKHIFPDAQVLCVEPRSDAQPNLQALARELPGIHVAQVLIGEQEGTIEFNEQGEVSSVHGDASGRAFGNVKLTPMTTLDRLVERHGLPLPDLIKLDLQGAELGALGGAARCLAHAQAVLIELSFHRIFDNAPDFADAVLFLRDRGFLSYDIFSLMQRPLDGALAQGDFLFLRHDSPLWSDRRWNEQGTFDMAGGATRHAIAAMKDKA